MLEPFFNWKISPFWNWISSSCTCLTSHVLNKAALDVYKITDHRENANRITHQSHHTIKSNSIKECVPWVKHGNILLWHNHIHKWVCIVLRYSIVLRRVSFMQLFHNWVMKRHVHWWHPNQIQKRNVSKLSLPCNDPH